MPTDILSSSRRKRRNKLFLKVGIFASLLIFFVSGIVGFFYISKFRINEISVEGANILDGAKIKDETANSLSCSFLKIVPCDNIFILSEAKIITGLLQKFPVLKNVAINRDFPQKISVILEERKPEALWCKASRASATSAVLGRECAFVDEKGFIFQSAPSFSGTIFLTFFDERQPNAGIGKGMMTESEFQKLLSFKELLVKNNINVAKIVIKDGEEREVYLKEGWYVKLNSKNEPNPSFNNLELILDTTIKEKRPKLEYIDLRFGKKVFFKYK